MSKTDKELDDLEARLREQATFSTQVCSDPTKTDADWIQSDAADAIAELRVKNAGLVGALKTVSDAADFYDKVDAASADEGAAVGGDHIDYCIDACKRARQALEDKENTQ